MGPYGGCGEPGISLIITMQVRGAAEGLRCGRLILFYVIIKSLSYQAQRNKTRAGRVYLDHPLRCFFNS